MATRNPYGMGGWWLEEQEYAQLLAAERAERERCIKAVCSDCRAGNAAALIDGQWVHPILDADEDDPALYDDCDAAAIRALPKREP